MSEFAKEPQKTSSFHIHLDGAVFPEVLERYAKSKYGFFNDPFDHGLLIDPAQGGEMRKLPARQLTLKIEDRFSGKDVRNICEDLSTRAQADGFAGLIQSEYVMTEALLRSEYGSFQPSPFPFYVHMRKIDPELGEDFKTHELHLELLTDQTDARLISEVARSGLSVVFSPNDVTFTAAGSLDAIRKIQEAMLDYLKRVRGFDQAKLVTEATVFHSLHQMRPENTPLVVDRMEFLQ